MPSIADQMKVFRLILFRSFEKQVVKMEAWVRLFGFLHACKLDATRENVTSVDDTSSLSGVRFQSTLESLARCAPDHPSILMVWSHHATVRSIGDYFFAVATNERTKELFHRGPFVWVASPEQWPDEWRFGANILPEPRLFTFEKPDGNKQTALALPLPAADGTTTERRALYFFLRNWLTSSRPSSQHALTVDEFRELCGKAGPEAATVPAKALSSRDADTILAKVIPKKPP